MVQPLHIKNALVWDGKETIRRDLFTDGERIAEKPSSGAAIIDLDGYTVFPGLINAHDHLELNHYPRSKFRERYHNTHQWGEDMNTRLDTEPYKTLRAYPLADRCFIGGLKNLLCGATTVAHHNPPHKCLFRKDFPVRVLQKYSWSHSLHFNTDEEIVRSYRSTPKQVPWFIHLAEGTDDEAEREYQRLKALGCVGSNTVVVHGVGMTHDDITDAAPKVRGLIWCPSTNKYLLGRTVTIRTDSYSSWRGKDRHVALSSDSRLTANGDLLDEVQEAIQSGPYDSDFILQAVTNRPAHICSLKDVGHLSSLARGDCFAAKGWPYSRSDVSLVVKGGVPQIGDPEVMAKVPHIQTVDAVLDGKPKSIHSDLARRIQKCSLKEPGLEVDKVTERRFFALW